MIEIKETLKVSPEEFFDQLAKSAAYDIRMATGKSVTEKQIYQGYVYTKQMRSKLGQTGNVKVKITEFNPPVCYCVKFESAAGINRIRYELEPLGEREVSVRYTEEFEGETKSQDLNYRIISGLYKRKAKKKTIRKLHDIEAYILKEGGSGVK